MIIIAKNATDQEYQLAKKDKLCHVQDVIVELDTARNVLELEQTLEKISHATNVIMENRKDTTAAQAHGVIDRL